MKLSKRPNLSLPIDRQLEKAILDDARASRLSRADVVRQILLRHYGQLPTLKRAS